MPRLKTLPPRIKTLEQRITPIEKVWHEFYDSPEWIQLVRRLIRERGRRCEKCGGFNIIVSGDHIVEILDGGEKLDESNVQLLCGQCHTKKTLGNRRMRMEKRY